MIQKKPVIKTIADDRGNVVDEIFTCGHCGAYICNIRKRDKELLYHNCTHCGMPIDWEGGFTEGVTEVVRPKKLDQPKEERKEE